MASILARAFQGVRLRLPNKFISLASFRAGITICTGTARNSGIPLSVVYVGNGGNLHFVLQMLFDDGASTESHGRCNIWNAASVVNRFRSSTDLSIIDLPYPYEVNYDIDERIIEVPAWIRQERTLGADWSSVIASFRRNVRGAQMRKVRKYGFTYQASRKVRHIDEFYDRYYVPHVRRRFGNAASIASRGEVRRAAARGTLLQIVRNGEVVAATVLLHEKSMLRMLFVGFSAADLRTIDGASAAMYLFTLDHSHKNGFTRVDFCGSRPLLSDGVLRTKRAWGASVFDDWALETLLFQFNNSNRAVLSTLATSPLVVRHDDMLVGKVLVNDAQLTTDRIQRLYHNYFSEGLDRLCVYATHGWAQDVDEAQDSTSGPLRLFDLQQCKDIVAAYCDDVID